MRASPLLLVLLVTGVFLGVLVPMVRVTGAAPAVTHVAAKSAGGQELLPARATVRWAHRPDSLQLTLGTVKWLALDKPEGESAEAEVELPFSPDGVEFLLQATWPDGTPATPLTVEVVPDGLDAHQETRWTDTASLSEVLVFRWKR